MIGCGFFDDEPPTGEQADELPRWASIPEISTFLDVSRDTIHAAVKQAWTDHEPWVQKEWEEDDNALYLIDTSHARYRSHQEQWKQQKEQQADFLDEPMGTWPRGGRALFPALSSAEPSLPSHATVPLTGHEQKNPEEFLQLWPRFRQWLCSRGVHVFQNLLAEEGQEKPWLWRWGDLHGEGYRSSEDAIIAALHQRLERTDAEREEQQEAALLHMLERHEHQNPEPRSSSWFRKNG